MRKTYNVVYIINIVFQSFFNLLFMIAASFGIAWLLVNKGGAEEWIYAPILLVGSGLGLFSMFKFLISATNSIERLRTQNEQKKSEKAGKDRKNDR